MKGTQFLFSWGCGKPIKDVEIKSMEKLQFHRKVEIAMERNINASFSPRPSSFCRVINGLTAEWGCECA
jgi:hypothetical protein